MNIRNYYVHKVLSCCLLICLTIVFTISGTIYGQKGGGVLSGIVRDSATQKPIMGAAVELNRELSALSDESGHYVIKGIPKGKYRIIASAGGFKTVIKENRTISLSEETENFSLVEKVGLVPSVTVKPRYFEKDLNEFVGSIRFNNEEVKRISGNFDDIVRTLGVLPGVAQVDNYRNDLIVRGGSPSENLYTVDGIIVPNINHFGNQGFSGGVMSFINMDYVSSTSFSSGGFSASFGDKISSVMQLNLRDGKNERLGGKAVLSATQFALNLEGPFLSNNTSFIISARRSYLDVVFKASGFSFAPEYYDFFAKASSKLSSTSKLSFIFFGVLDHVKFFNEAGNVKEQNPRAMGSNQKNIISAVSFKNIFSNGYFNLSLSANRFRYETVPNDRFENRSLEQEYSFKGDFVLNLTPEDELDIGSLVKVVNFDAYVKLKDYSTNYDDYLASQGNTVKKEYLKGGVYNQFSHRFGNWLKMGMGVRMDFYNAGGEDFTLSPRFFTQFSLSKWTNLNLSAGQYMQSPNYLWNSVNPANSKLKSISCQQVTASLEHSLNEETEVSLEGFYKMYDDYPASTQRPYLVMANTGAGFAGGDDCFSSFGLDTLINGGKGVAKGVEFSVQKRFSSPLWGAFNITYSHTSFKGVDRREHTGSYDQTWILNFVLGYVFDEKWEMDLKFRYASGIPYTPFDENGRQDPLNYNSLRLDEQHSLDIRLDRRWEFNSWKMRTYLDIQNVYNHKVRTSLRWERSEKRIANDPILGIVPSIGLSLEF